MDRDKLLATTALFRGSKPEEIAAMLGCLGMRTRKYRAGERIHRMGDVISTVGLVLEGAVRIESVTVWGDVSVIGTAGPGQMFGEAYAAVPDEPLMVDVVAAGACEVMFLEVAKVLATCPHACPHHARASANLTAAIARRSIGLSRRILHVTPKTIRGKVLAYLSDEAEREGSNEFEIPFNRQQLADYLGVDRSALSSELSRMQRDGLIKTNRSRFMLMD
jgi:CRP-like cAMP-binding protein